MWEVRVDPPTLDEDEEPGPRRDARERSPEVVEDAGAAMAALETQATTRRWPPPRSQRKTDRTVAICDKSQ